jgi:molybdate transport system regulatory protein
MKLSARNQLIGTIKDIKEDQLMAEITVTIAGGQELVSVITVTSARRLDLKPGKSVVVVIKSTEVMLAIED